MAYDSTKILQDVKVYLGGEPMLDDATLDQTILQHINTAVADTIQIGIGPQTGLEVDPTTNWTDLYGTSYSNPVLVKSYIRAKVKLRMDPPQSSSLLKALEDTVKECETRMYLETRYYPS